MWITLLVVQSIPYVAAVSLSLISSFERTGNVAEHDGDTATARYRLPGALERSARR